METKKCYPVVHTDKDKLFTFVERGENDVVVCVGNQIVSSITFKTWKDAKEYTKRKTWELMVNVMCVIAEKVKGETSHETDK